MLLSMIINSYITKERALHRGGILDSHPAAPGSILGVPQNFNILDVVEINQQHLGSGKLKSESVQFCFNARTQP